MQINLPLTIQWITSNLDIPEKYKHLLNKWI